MAGGPVPALARPGPWLWALLAGALALPVGLLLAGASTTLVALLVLALGGGTVAVWTREPRRLMVVALFATLPLDISKALVAPEQQFYSPGLYLMPAQIVGLGLLLMWLLQRLFAERRLPGLQRPDGLVLLFLALLWWSAWRSPQGFLALASAAAYSLYVVAAWGAARSIRDTTDLRLALLTTATMVLLELLHVAAQMATQSLLPLPGSKSEMGVSLLNFGGEGFAFRPSGFFPHPNTLGHHMTMVLPVALALVLLGRSRLPARPWWLAVAVLLAGAAMLLLTLSRGGWASGILGGSVVIGLLAWLGVLNRRHLAGLVLTVLVGAVAVVSAYPQILLRLTGSDSRSLESRVLQSDQALTIIRANPLAGVGYGAYNRASFEYQGPLWSTVSQDFQEQLRKVVVHNGYLLLAAELGIPTTLLFVYVFFAFVRLPWPLHRWRDPSLLGLAVGLCGSLMGQMLYVSSDNYYADIRVLMLWVTAGLMQATVRIGTQAAGPVDAGTAVPVGAEAAVPAGAEADGRGGSSGGSVGGTA